MPARSEDARINAVMRRFRFVGRKRTRGTGAEADATTVLLGTFAGGAET